MEVTNVSPNPPTTSAVLTSHSGAVGFVSARTPEPSGFMTAMAQPSRAASNVPSRDQAGYSPLPIAARPVPSARITNSRPASESANAIRSPSGDHVGDPNVKDSPAGFFT